MAEHPFDPVTLSKIANMELRAKLVADAVLTGIHKSPYKGSSIEFLEHKEYSPGNEIKHIDWKVQARTDKYYVKQFEEETNLRCYIFLDASGSMGYKSTGMSKYEYASALAASLSYLLLKQSDLVGLIGFADTAQRFIPPRSRLTHFHVLINELVMLKAAGKSHISKILNEFVEKVSRHSLIIVISDFFDDMKEMMHQLKSFQFRKNEIILFQVLDPYELTFPFETITYFESMEDDRRVLAEPKTIKERYLFEINRFIEQFKHQCFENQMDYWLVNTSAPLHQTLINYLARRKSALYPFLKI
ncbi:MAG: DUF58 domain-containing protein [Candidatus Brocadiaceae bacterium]|nr:DUF58 domain-containing protein [Candidatus Brocadiaceae bacterium]